MFREYRTKKLLLHLKWGWGWSIFTWHKFCVPSLEVFKATLDRAAGNQVTWKVSLLKSRGLEIDGLKYPF